MPWRRRSHIEQVLQRAARAGRWPVKRTLREFTLTVSETCQPLFVPAESGIESVRVYDNSGSGSLRSWFCKRSKGESSEWLTISDVASVYLGLDSTRVAKERASLRLP